MALYKAAFNATDLSRFLSTVDVLRPSFTALRVCSNKGEITSRNVFTFLAATSRSKGTNKYVTRRYVISPKNEPSSLFCQLIYCISDYVIYFPFMPLKRRMY